MRKFVFAVLAAGSLSLVVFDAAVAQVEEIIVTARKSTRGGDDLPGLVLKKRADNFIQRVSVINDTRDATLRRSEIMATMRDLIAAAKISKSISLAIEGDFTVTPLTASNLEKVSVNRFGGKSDTEVISFLIKASIPSRDLDAKLLAREISEFVAGAREVGRSEVSANGSLQISVIDPGKYRTEVVKLITDDVNAVTRALSGNYVVELEGLDQPMYWQRIGFTDMAFFIDYNYSVMPGGAQ